MRSIGRMQIAARLGHPRKQALGIASGAPWDPTRFASPRNTRSTSISIASLPHSGYQPTLYSESRCKADKVPGLLAKSRASMECTYFRGQLAGKPRYHGED